MRIPKWKFNIWLTRTEETISNALSEILDRDWDENDATKSWMRALRRQFSKVEIVDLGRPYAVAWDTAKLKGKCETKYGDIGVLVRINYPNGVTSEGIGFIEAKRIFPSGRYQEIKREQLSRMLTATAHHRLGLYERMPIREARCGIAGHGMEAALSDSLIVGGAWKSVFAAVVPTSIALQMQGNRRRDLHPPCLPLSYQLCARYLAGYDLDSSADRLDEVKRGIGGAPLYLLIANVSIGGETTPTTDDLIRVGPEGPYDAIEPDQIREAENMEIVSDDKRIEEQWLTVSN